jgi:DtxR family transcriptional regulator, Mn-dependent transcriptional regulator
MVNKQADRSRDRAREDYLKAIYQLSDGNAVKAAELARHLRVSRASVSKIRRVLEHDGLIGRARRRADALTLTRRGLGLAVRVVRRHRLVETFLYRSLGVPLERLHRAAEKLEHSISDDVARRLSDFLGNPKRDPHGHPIPGTGSEKRERRELSLSDVSPGTKIVVLSLDDADEKVVRKLDALGVLPGLRATVASDRPGVTLRTANQDIVVSQIAAGRVRCMVR